VGTGSGARRGRATRLAARTSQLDLYRKDRFRCLLISWWPSLGLAEAWGLDSRATSPGPGSARAWNRTRAAAEPLAGEGAVVAGSPAEAAEGADVILTMLPDAGTVLGAMESARPGAGEGAIWLQISAIGEQGTERCIRLANDVGLAFVDAPVLGTRQPAQEGKLVVLAPGPDEVRPRVQPVLDAVGQRTLWCSSWLSRSPGTRRSRRCISGPPCAAR
jgi:NAD binding domain of 6-phosphogluconate dehydrogenase